MSRKTTGSSVLSIWLRMNDGFIEMVSKRNFSEPSGALGPKASAGSSVALQQTPTRSHERTRRAALCWYMGEYIVIPTNWLDSEWHMLLISTSDDDMRIPRRSGVIFFSSCSYPGSRSPGSHGNASGPGIQRA